MGCPILNLRYLYRTISLRMREDQSFDCIEGIEGL